MSSQPVPGETAAPSPAPTAPEAHDPLNQRSVSTPVALTDSSRPRPKTVDDLFKPRLEVPETSLAQEPPAAAEPQTEPVQAEPAAPDAEDEGQADSDLIFEDADGKKKLDWKKLRTREREARKAVEEKETLITTLNEKVKKYESGETIPEPLQRLTDRVNQLEKYEKIVSFKTSPEYVEKYGKPIEESVNRLEQLAADYEVPMSEIQKAIGTENEAQLNRMLSDNFDPVGALEVKQLVTKVRDVSKAAIQAEQDPVAAMEQLRQENARVSQVKERQKLEAISGKSKDAWNRTLNQIKAEGKLHQLILKEGDSEHNKNYAEPILQKASGEYVKLLKGLVANGLQSLPDELADALAKMVQYSQALAIEAPARVAAEQFADELLENTRRTNSHVRPTVGARFSGPGAGAGGAPRTAEQAGQSLIDAARGKK